MSISLDFLGAAGTVTGSKTLLHLHNQQHLIDCGLFQGGPDLRQRNWKPSSPPAETIRSVTLTHAHLDHSGFLPRLYKEGFRGPIHCSNGTAELCKILLLDAAHLQEEDADYANRSHYSYHKPALPLFTTQDVEATLKLLVPHPRNEWFPIDQDFSTFFLRSGHIVGSSFVKSSVIVNGAPKLITFSGDIGHFRSRTLKGPMDLLETDVLIIESTYGDRPHARTDPLIMLEETAKRTFDRKGVLIIPAFAVGRSQEILHLFRILEDEGRIPKVPILLDSPMSNAATNIFLNNSEDSPLHSSFSGGVNNFFPSKFEAILSADESIFACMREGPLVIIAAAGMLSGGRVLHHLKQRLPHKENTVLFVGYQAEGSKGRFLQDQGKSLGSLRIHHEEVDVEAEIATLPHLSAHGDAQDIVDWIGRFTRKPSRIFVNHGSIASCTALATRINAELGLCAEAITSERRVSLW